MNLFRHLRRISGAGVCLAVAMLAAPSARALGPHEIAVVVNDRSLDSILLGHAYARIRNIPPDNVIRVEVPDALYMRGFSMSPDEFTQYIWNPVTTALKERSLDAQILAWAYSCDFPTRVRTDPAISITALTFLRNRLPTTEEIHRATYASPIYVGPAAPPKDATSEPSDAGTTTSLDTFRTELLDRMPIPAFMLGFTRERGITLDESTEALERAASGDRAWPAAPFVFWLSPDDIRTRCRQWEYAPATNSLERLDAKSVFSTSIPTNHPIAGLVSGTTDFPRNRGEFVPGAYADHLTSFGASFETGGQTKIVQWLRNGAGATSGTVTEPLAHWRKFATANIFVHHRRGATVLEALYLSTACPLQLLPMGDPLAAPWAPKISVHIVNRPETVSGPKTLFTARRRNADPVNSPVDMENAETIWLTDGHFTATGDEFLFDSTQLPNGRHTIRAVVRTPGPLRHQCFDEVEFTVANDQATP